MKLLGDNSKLIEQGEQGDLHGRLAGLRIKQLLLVVALDQQRSIRKAADEIHVSQAAASKALIDLEQTLGMRLFDRNRTGLQTTQAGVCMIGHAKEILQSQRRMCVDLARMQRGQQETLRIGSIMGAVPESLSKCLHRLQDLVPSLMVEAEEGTSAELMRQLGSGEVDLVFAREERREERRETDETGEGIESLPLTTEEVYVAAGMRHALSADEVYDCGQFTRYPWISYETSAPLSSLLHDWFERQGAKVPAIRLRTTSALITVSALNETDWLALLPRSVFGLIGAQGRIKRIQTRLPLSLGGYCAYWSQRSPRQNFIQLALRELVHALP